ncbi:hypothetical protein BBJ28_00004040 [Nothophytophthora sp. Chile5]|nr:hypothetical protein BBJ28_00004040 [Nothophytophthora sp. Chile5]
MLLAIVSNQQTIHAEIQNKDSDLVEGLAMLMFELDHKAQDNSPATLQAIKKTFNMVVSTSKLDKLVAHLNKPNNKVLKQQLPAFLDSKRQHERRNSATKRDDLAATHTEQAANWDAPSWLSMPPDGLIDQSLPAAYYADTTFVAAKMDEKRMSWTLVWDKTAKCIVGSHGAARYHVAYSNHIYYALDSALKSEGSAYTSLVRCLDPCVSEASSTQQFNMLPYFYYKDLVLNTSLACETYVASHVGARVVFLITVVVVLVVSAALSLSSMPVAGEEIKGKYKDFERGWYLTVGMSITTMMLLNAPLPQLQLFSRFCVVAPLRLRYKRRSTRSQEQMEKLYAGPVFDISVLYPMTIGFSSIAPLRTSRTAAFVLSGVNFLSSIPAMRSVETFGRRQQLLIGAMGMAIRHLFVVVISPLSAAGM